MSEELTEDKVSKAFVNLLTDKEKLTLDTFYDTIFNKGTDEASRVLHLLRCGLAIKDLKPSEVKLLKEINK